MPEQLARLAVVFLSVTVSYHNLRPDAESEAQHIQHHIVHAGDSACAQFKLSYPSEEDGVGHPYQLLHHEADKNGVRHLPYFFVTVLFHIRAAKIMLFYRILLQSGIGAPNANSSPEKMVISPKFPV